MKNLRKFSRNELKNIDGGIRNPQEHLAGDGGGGTDGCKQCVSCSNRQGSPSCYTDPNGDCAKALSMAKSLC